MKNGTFWRDYLIIQHLRQLMTEAGLYKIQDSITSKTRHSFTQHSHYIN